MQLIWNALHSKNTLTFTSLLSVLNAEVVKRYGLYYNSSIWHYRISMVESHMKVNFHFLAGRTKKCKIHLGWKYKQWGKDAFAPNVCCKSGCMTFKSPHHPCLHQARSSGLQWRSPVCICVLFLLQPRYSIIIALCSCKWCVWTWYLPLTICFWPVSVLINSACLWKFEVVR